MSWAQPFREQSFNPDIDDWTCETRLRVARSLDPRVARGAGRTADQVQPRALGFFLAVIRR